MYFYTHIYTRIYIDRRSTVAAAEKANASLLCDLKDSIKALLKPLRGCALKHRVAVAEIANAENATKKNAKIAYNFVIFFIILYFFLDLG